MLCPIHVRSLNALDEVSKPGYGNYDMIWTIFTYFSVLYCTVPPRHGVMSSTQCP